MFSRRKFLQLIGIAPVAAPAVADHVFPGERLASGGMARISHLIGERGPEAIIPLRRLEVDASPLQRRLDGIMTALRVARADHGNTPPIRAARCNLSGLPERISRERAKSVRRA